MLLIIGLCWGPAAPALAVSTVVDSPASLAEAFGKATGFDFEVELGADIVVPIDGPTIAVPDGEVLKLDLAGHRLEVMGAGGEGIPEAASRAGIGVPPSAELIISDSAGDGELTAAGLTGAGIGGRQGDPLDPGSGDSGAVTITSGTVIATSTAGAGIGGGDLGDAGPITINGGTVTATGEHSGAGIGGGYRGNGGAITINGGTVTVTSDQGAAIGGGQGASGGAVMIGADGDVTARGDRAVGGGIDLEQEPDPLPFGSLSNAGRLTIPEGSTLTVPDRDTAANSGTIDGAGVIAGAGAVENLGSIMDTITVEPTVTVSDNNYLLQFDANGGEGTLPRDRRVYAATLAAAGLTVPDSELVLAGYTFSGWYKSEDGAGEGLTAGARLSEREGPDWIRFFAGWEKSDQAAPTLTGPETTSFTVGQEAVYGPIVSGNPAPTVTAKGLPDGLVIDQHTGKITGIPAEGTEGSHQVVLTASNGVEPNATLSVALEISPAPIRSFELSATPLEVRVGDVLTISGAGLPEGTEVALRVGLVDVGTAIVMGDGAFILDTSVPELPPGDHAVSATAVVDGATLSEVAPLRVLPDSTPPPDDPTPTPSPDDPAPDDDAAADHDGAADPDGAADNEGTADDEGTDDQDSSTANDEGADHDGADDNGGGTDDGATADHDDAAAADQAAAADGDESLPNTGSDLPIGLLIGAGTLLVAGTAALLIGRHRRTTGRS